MFDDICVVLLNWNTYLYI